MYTAWFRIWQDVYVTQLLYKPKWFRSDKDLIEGDLVYFVKTEGKLSNKWTIGMVDSVEKGRDGILREVSIKYCNSSEQRLSLTGNSSKDKTMPRYTERAVRKIVKKHCKSVSLQNEKKTQAPNHVVIKLHDGTVKQRWDLTMNSNDGLF
jgi:hypothetical protein